MQVVLTDGDASSLENLKLNLEMNKIENLDVSLDKSDSSLCTVSFDLWGTLWNSYVNAYS